MKDDCIKHPGYIDPISGYGKKGGNGRIIAHRDAWEKVNGPVPSGLCVLHKCDNRACINPDHLFLGTQLDNIADRHMKGRDARGSTHGMAKITEEQARYIMQSDESIRSISRRLGVGFTAVWRIRKGISWRHLKENKV